MLNISIASNVRDQVRRVAEEHKRQIGFATVKAVNELAKIAAAEEKKGLSEFFDNPTPFTVNSVAIKFAKKGNPTATIYIRPLAARYIAPYEFGGKQYLGDKPADLVPIDATSNQYGNLPRNTIKRYLNRKDVFWARLICLWLMAATDTTEAYERPRAKVGKQYRQAKIACSI